MPNTNFPDGFSHGVSILGMPILNMYSGDVFWVNSATGNDSLQHSGTRSSPFATIDYAFSRVDQNGTNGDVVLVAPNHAETISAAGGVTQDIAGVAVIGLGTGNQRPNLTMSDALSTWLVSASNSHIKNIVFTSSVNTCATAIATSDAAIKGLTVEDCAFNDGSLTDQHFVSCISGLGTTNADNDDLTVTGCHWNSEDVACAEFIAGTADISRLHITNNYIDTSGTACTLFAPTTAGDTYLGVWVADNLVSHLGTTATVNSLFDGGTATDNTGFVVRNSCGHIDTAGVVLIDCTGVAIDENYSNSVLGNTGAVLYPAADTV